MENIQKYAKNGVEKPHENTRGIVGKTREWHEND